MTTDASVDASEPRDAGPAGSDGGRDAEFPDGGDETPPEAWHALSAARSGPTVFISDDGHEFERFAISSEAAGSVHGVGASDGVFYFEMTSLVSDDPRQRFGVGPAEMSPLGDVGDFPMSLGVSERGEIVAEGELTVATFEPGPETFGFVVDRRGDAPRVHVVAGETGAGGVLASFSFQAFEGPLHAYVSGPRLKLGAQARFNAGHDTVNHPFAYDPVAALAPIDPEAARALVAGWGRSESAPWHEPPTVSLSGPPTATPGEAVVIDVAAFDPEDGDLSARVVLEDDALPHSRRAIELGPGGTFRSEVLGRHRLRAHVVDSGGKRAEAVHTIDVLGAPKIEDDVWLAKAHGDGAVISADGLGVRFTQASKDGVRANQGLLDAFWYFEVTRAAPPGNFGAGLVVAEGSLAPYGGRAVPASMSVNFWSGIWHDIVWVAPQPEGGPHLTVGFAVDFRRDLEAGKDFPVVYVIIADVLAAEVPMPDATTAVFPMLYGTVGQGTGPQLVANFGERPFLYDARAALGAAGHPGAAALELGWGPHARP